MTLIRASLLAAVACMAAVPISAHAAGKSADTETTLTETGYTQDFDSLAGSGTNNSALPAGVQIAQTGTGSRANGAYAAGTGSSNTGDIYSFGNSSDRALGSLASGGTGTNLFGVIFVNGLDRIMETLEIAYRGEQWRAGNSPDDGLTFQYATDVTSIDSGSWITQDALGFSPLVTSGNTALDGNVFSTDIFGSITGLSVAPGARFGIRWVDLNSTGSDHGLAIDNLSVTAGAADVAGAVPEPASWALLLLGFFAVGGSLRRRMRMEPLPA